QNFILDLIMKQLDQSVEKENIKIEWPIEELRKMLKALDSSQEVFLSDRVKIVANHPQELIADPEKIYHANILLDEPNRKTTLVINIQVEDSTDKKEFTLHDSNNTPVTEIIAGAMMRAEDEAFKYAVRYLQQFNINYFWLLEDKSYLIKKIVTDKTYLSLLAAKKIPLHPFFLIKEASLPNLMNCSIKYLIKSELITVTDASKLRKEVVTVLAHPLYLSLFKTLKLRLSDLIVINNRESAKILTHPGITQLVQANRLLFKQVTEFPIDILKLFDQSMFAEYLLKESTDVSFLVQLTAEHCQLLSHPEIIMQIKNQLMTPAELFSLTKPALKKIIDSNKNQIANQDRTLPQHTKHDHGFFDLKEKDNPDNCLVSKFNNL
ncbi:MAG: hypothetical protein Q8M40_00935, partial [Legionella sp.]|nr:hypothetical protein [Legionella sp.]